MSLSLEMKLIALDKGLLKVTFFIHSLSPSSQFCPSSYLFYLIFSISSPPPVDPLDQDFSNLAHCGPNNSLLSGSVLLLQII